LTVNEPKNFMQSQICYFYVLKISPARTLHTFEVLPLYKVL